MKNCFFACLGAFCLLGLSSFLGAAEKVAGRHRIVFEFVSEVPKRHETLLNNLDNVLEALGTETEIIVVAHGGGISLLQKPEKELTRRMEKLVRQGVIFAACENTMKKKKLRKEDLLTLATTVDSGIAEVVRRQEAGFSYVKSGG